LSNAASIEIDSFCNLRKLIADSRIETTEFQRKSLILLCRQLKNEKLVTIFFGLSLETSSSVDFEFCPNEPSQESIIASCFHSCSLEILSLFDFETLKDAISNELLILESKDALLNTIFEHGPVYYSLLGCVHYEFLSASGLVLFLIVFLSQC
jgi:hypothetical protein